MGEPNRASSETIAQKLLRKVEQVAGPDGATGSMLEGLAGLHAIVIAVDADLRITWLSDSLDLVLGGAERVLGRPASSILDGLWPDDVAAFGDQTRRFFDEMVANGRVTRARFDLRSEGRTLPLEVSGFQARDAKGNEIVICVADRHETLEALERENEELETCLRTMSHDLRSPLASLLGFSRLLRDEYGATLDATGLHFVDRIEQASRNMKRLLNDMLEFSRIGATAQRRSNVNPSPVLEQLQAELKFQLDEKHIQLNLPEDPPSLLCDRTRLYQLLSNLVGNAIHHMEDGRRGRIDVEFEALADGCQIVVADDGPGIPPEDHERIFEVFQTSGTSRNGKQNSGLGLAIVKKIVDAHAGRVWVESEVGAGTRFFVWLPSA